MIGVTPVVNLSVRLPASPEYMQRAAGDVALFSLTLRHIGLGVHMLPYMSAWR